MHDDAIRTGFLVLADLSGFTAFVTATELKHGPPLVAELLERMALAPERIGLVPHTERYEHLGEVECFVGAMGGG